MRKLFTGRQLACKKTQTRMPLISNSHKCIFIRVPKTASSAVLTEGFPEALKWEDNEYKEPLDEWGFWKEDYDLWYQDSNHLPLSTVRKLIDPSEIDDYVKFAFVRNPWAKAVSQYFYVRKWIRQLKGPWHKDTKAMKGPLVGGKRGLRADLKTLEKRYEIAKIKNFDMYVKHAWSNWDKKYLMTQTEMTEGCDFVGRMYNLQADFNYICDKLKVPQKKLIKKNTTSHEHYSSYYTPETRQIIAELFEDDIKNFNFEYVNA